MKSYTSFLFFSFTLYTWSIWSGAFNTPHLDKMHILYHKNKAFVTHHSYFFTYYPLRLFYLVWRSSDYKHLLCRIRRWSPIQFTMCTCLLINLFDCLTSCTMTVYKTKPLTLLSIKHIKGYMHQTYTPPQKKYVRELFTNKNGSLLVTTILPFPLHCGHKTWSMHAVKMKT